MLTELCEVSGANIRDVAKGIGLDQRIGPRFLHAGIGYGGSCFPKDVKALMAIGKKLNVPLPLIKATHDVNQRQRERFFQKIVNTLPERALIGIWGLAFKPNTDDMREAPSLDLIPLLLKTEHTVRAFDPVAMENARKILPRGVEFVDSPLAAAKEADAVVLLTEWDVFRGIDLKELKEAMRGRDLFDGRNVYDPEEVRSAGFVYHGIGVK
jgi:UDPglucose 6-dehydrogenase